MNATAEILCAVLLAAGLCGCATEQTVRMFDAEHPELRLTRTGVYMGNERIPAADIVDALEEAQIPKDRAIHILMEENLSDLRTFRALRALLARGGYTRALVVTKEHGESRTKSGKTYAGSERFERRDDVDFYVCGDGVTYGRLTRLDGLADVELCLKRFKIGKDQLIRLNYNASEEKSADGRKRAKLEIVLRHLEKLLKDRGYVHVVRVRLE